MAVPVFVKFVVLRCEFVFSIQDFAAPLWSAQACLRFKGDGTFPSAAKAAASCRTPKSAVKC